MKILFLDVDGVLNCSATKETMPDGFRFVEDRFIEILKNIIDKTGAKIVLSSDWRLFDEAKKLLSDKLNEFGLEIYDVTPNLRWDIRGAECNNWAMKHDVEKWIAVDDTPELFSNPDWVIETDEQYGLTNDIVEEIIRRLE